MTQEEKTENDWKYHEGSVPRENATFPVNPMDNFDCPVCNAKRYVRRGDMHRFHMMDNGHEVQDY